MFLSLSQRSSLQLTSPSQKARFPLYCLGAVFNYLCLSWFSSTYNSIVGFYVRMESLVSVNVKFGVSGFCRGLVPVLYGQGDRYKVLLCSLVSGQTGHLLLIVRSVSVTLHHNWRHCSETTITSHDMHQVVGMSYCNQTMKGHLMNVHICIEVTGLCINFVAWNF